MMNVVFVGVTTVYVQIVLAYQMAVLTWMNVTFVILILLMTVYRIVLVLGVELL